MKALLVDCCGVLADIERGGHRIAFNLAFKRLGLEFEWSEQEYRKLLEISGGKERLKYFLSQVGYESGAREMLVAELHSLKTDLLIGMVKSGQMRARRGIRELIEEALHCHIKVAICSAANERLVQALVSHLLGGTMSDDRRVGIFAGDMVPRKKPDPAIYTLASKRLGVPPNRVVVIEDSRNGLLAAKAAGMACAVTPTGYTQDDDFSGADAVFADTSELSLPALVDLVTPG